MEKRINKNQIVQNIYREHFDPAQWFRAHLAMLAGSHALKDVKTPDQVADEEAAEAERAIIKRTKQVPYRSKARKIKNNLKQSAGSRRQYVKQRKMLALLVRESKKGV